MGENVGDRVSEIMARVKRLREPMIRRRKEVVDRFLGQMEKRRGKRSSRSEESEETSRVAELESEKQTLQLKVEDLERQLRARVALE